MSNPVVHFEMPYEDAERVAEFYKKAFGWNMNKFAEMGDYVVAETDETKDGRPTKPGVINGGFYPKNNDRPAQYPSVVVAVDDIKQAIKDVEAAGGEVLGEPIDIQGVGAYVSFMDCEGNRVSILQPNM